MDTTSIRVSVVWQQFHCLTIIIVDISLLFWWHHGTAPFYIPGSEIGIGAGIEFASAFAGIIIGFTTALREIGYVCASKLENSLI